MSQEFQLVHNDGGKRDGDTDAHKESFLTGKSEGKAITEAHKWRGKKDRIAC